MPTDVHPGGVVRDVSVAARPAPRPRYLPLAEHGLIGDLHTVALVGTDRTTAARIDAARQVRDRRRGSAGWLASALKRP
jgi:hypothetical protein